MLMYFDLWPTARDFTVVGIFYFINWIVAVEAIKGEKLFKGGTILGIIVFVFFAEYVVHGPFVNFWFFVISGSRSTSYEAYICGRPGYRNFYL